MSDERPDAAYLADLLARCRAEIKELKAERDALRQRAEKAEAEKDAAMAAEREECVGRLESLKDTAYQNNLLAEGVTYSCAIDAILALITDTEKGGE